MSQHEDDGTRYGYDVEEALQFSLPFKLPVSLVEQAVFNPPEGMEQYRAFRIEYGGHGKECIREGEIWLPPDVDPERIEKILTEGERT